MAVRSAVVLLVLVASVFGNCPRPSLPPLLGLDRTKLAGTWQTLWWPKEYTSLYKCGNQTFEPIGNHVNYRVKQYEIVGGEYSENNTGIIRQVDGSGRFFGIRFGFDHLIKWEVLGFVEDKWISYWQCIVETGSQKSFVLKKYGVELGPDDLIRAEAARPFPEDYYGLEDYTNCPNSL